jgi:ParB-like nuclease domain
MPAKSGRKPPAKSTLNGGNASLQTRVISVRLSDLKLLEKNARYMKGPQFERLVENIRRDGVLTSFPLVHREGEALVVISGNHRVSAAIKAGIEESDVIEVTSPLTRQQFVALQLSHNAIAGQDDPNILRSLYDELDFGWKEYSGLTDDAFNVDDLDTSVLRVEQPFYEELTISFLPGDADVFRGWLDKIGSSTRAGERLVGLYEDFGVFFEQLLAVKAAKDVRNSAVALRLMAELAGQALADQEMPQKAARATNRASADARE